MMFMHLLLPLIHSYNVQDNIATIQDNAKGSNNPRNSKQMVDGASNPQKRNKKDILSLV